MYFFLCTRRKAKNSKEDNVDEVHKLIKFFTEMKVANEKKSSTYRLMPVTVSKTFSGQMQAAKEITRTLVTA